MELVIGSNDRAVYSYQLVASGPNKTPCLTLKNKWQLFGQVRVNSSLATFEFLLSLNIE